MPIPTYIPGYPPDGSSLGQTKAVIRNNLDGTFETLGVDHINNNGQPGTQPAGYHNVSHWVPQGADPVAIAGYGQLYSKTVSFNSTNDQQLFWETGNGLIQQLTTGITPTINVTDGYTFLPGGIIIEWGIVSVGSTPVAVTFPFKFPTAARAITALRNQSTNSVLGYQSLSQTGVSFVANGASSAANVTWIAIGN